MVIEGEMSYIVPGSPLHLFQPDQSAHRMSWGGERIDGRMEIFSDPAHLCLLLSCRSPEYPWINWAYEEEACGIKHHGLDLSLSQLLGQASP